MIIEDFEKYLQSENMTAGTIRNVLSNYREFECFCLDNGTTITRAGVSTCREYLSWLAKRPNYHNGKPLSSSTRAKHYDSLKRLELFLIEKGIGGPLVTGITRPAPKQKTIQGFSADQVQAILDAVRHTRQSEQYKDRLTLLIFTLVNTGLRISEVLALKPNNIDHNKRTMVVTGKGNKERDVPLSRLLSMHIRSYIEQYHIERDGYLFASRYGRPLSPASIRDILRSVRKRLGPELEMDTLRVSPHTFRHTFAKLWVTRGGNTIALSRIMGHTTTAMTDRYVRLWGIDLLDAYDLCDPCRDIKIDFKPSRLN